MCLVDDICVSSSRSTSSARCVLYHWPATTFVLLNIEIPQDLLCSLSICSIQYVDEIRRLVLKKFGNEYQPTHMFLEILCKRHNRATLVSHIIHLCQLELFVLVRFMMYEVLAGCLSYLSFDKCPLMYVSVKLTVASRSRLVYNWLERRKMILTQDSVATNIPTETLWLR